MSLIRIAMRIAARQALLGRTEAGNNVLDSKMDAFRLLNGADGRPAPFIAIYTDSAKADFSGFAAVVANGTTDVTFEIAYSEHYAETDAETDHATIYPDVPATDDNFEFFLDLVSRQILDALSAPDNEWADLFREMIKPGVGVVERETHSSAVSGVRVAMHHIRLTFSLWPDPVKGGDLKPESPMAKFFALVETLDDVPTKAKAARMLAAIEPGNASPLDIAIRRYGLTHAEAEALLLTMPAGVPDTTTISDVVLGDAEIRHDNDTA